MNAQKRKLRVVSEQGYLLISHDINTPLTILHLGLNALRERAGQGTLDPEKTIREIERLQRAAEKIEQILLQFTEAQKKAA
jgi:signal transduction histidine kinase